MSWKLTICWRGTSSNYLRQCGHPQAHCANERKNVMFPCRLQKAQRRDSSQLISITKNRRVHKLPWRCRNVLSLGREYYWQIELHELEKEGTAFSSRHGVHQYTCMSFGLNNAPTMVQWVLDIILSSVKWQLAVFYLEDIVKFSQTPRQHIKYTLVDFIILTEADVPLKLNKFTFFSNKIDCFGHVIRSSWIEVANHTTDTVLHLNVSTTQAKLGFFIGSCNVFRNFVQNFADITPQLTARLCTWQATEYGHWSEEELIALRSLQQKLISPPISALTRKAVQCTLVTDPCDRQIGCLLLQKQGDNVN